MASIDKKVTPQRPRVNIDLRSLGRSGLRQYGGIVAEDDMHRLTGQRGMRTYQEMVDNDAVAGTINFAIDQLCRGAKWRIKEASSADADLEARDFVDQCKDDMEMPFTDFISEAMTMLKCGFSVHEQVFKRRAGDSPMAEYRSKFSDGRVGWRGFPMRAQDTILKWKFSDSGAIEGFTQVAPPLYQPVYIPIRKALLFRTSVEKNNPEGKSLFRRAVRSWRMKRGIENIEAVGIERDLVGIPVGRVPEEYLLEGADPQKAALAEDMVKVVTNMRRDEQEGVVLPSAKDENGNELYDIKLMTTGGTRQFDTDKVIQRHDHRIAMSALADFLLLGQGVSGSGSWAMHSDKTQLFAKAIDAFLDVIAQTLNRFAIPLLFECNDFKLNAYPTFEHESIDEVDIKDIAGYVATLSQAGANLFPNPELESHLLAIAGLPTGEATRMSPAENIVAPGIDENTEVSQIQDPIRDNEQ